jgi:cytochrome c-type biogenesis protein CcmE
MNSPEKSSHSLNKGALISGIVAIAAIAILTMAFLSVASPYVTLQEARQLQGDGLHIVGQLQKKTIANDFERGVLRFTMNDTNGDPVRVEYQGASPANLSEATRVVAIGKLEGDTFHARKLLVKCPSKYKAATKS